MTEIITEHIIVGDGFEANVSVAWEWVDYGIGGYEYWGTPGIDVRMMLETTGFFVEEVVMYDDDNNVEEIIPNTPEMRELFPDEFAAIFEWVAEEVAKLSPPDEDYPTQEEPYDY